MGTNLYLDPHPIGFLPTDTWVKCASSLTCMEITVLLPTFSSSGKAVEETSTTNFIKLEETNCTKTQSATPENKEKGD
jgi:hypothetical protein